MNDRTKLNRLLNKEFIYKQENIVITDHFEDSDKGTINIVTKQKTIKIKSAELPAFLESLLPVDDTNTTAVAVVSKETGGLLTTLQETLLDNIERVKADPGYIKQANTVNSSVNALVGMAKLRVQVERMNAGKK
jgi:hypothetical protein